MEMTDGSMIETLLAFDALESLESFEVFGAFEDSPAFRGSRASCRTTSETLLLEILSMSASYNRC